MTTNARRGMWSTIGYWLKRTLTSIYGPAELPDDVDPVTRMDRERGTTADPKTVGHPTERQTSYDNLPRGAE